MSNRRLDEGDQILGYGTLEVEYQELTPKAVLPHAITLQRGVVVSSEKIDEVPEQFKLQQNYPNPFNPVTQILYTLAKDAKVRIVVYNIPGQKVDVIVEEHQSAGRYEVTFYASDMSSGTYLYRLEVSNPDGVGTSDFTKTRQLLRYFCLCHHAPDNCLAVIIQRVA